MKFLEKILKSDCAQRAKSGAWACMFCSCLGMPADEGEKEIQGSMYDDDVVVPQI